MSIFQFHEPFIFWLATPFHPISVQCKHLKGQLGAPKNVFVTKNEHFFKLCQDGQLELPMNDEKCVFVMEMNTFSSLKPKDQLGVPGPHINDGKGGLSQAVSRTEDIRAERQKREVRS